MALSARSTLTEVMDDADLDAATYQRCLSDLAALNRVTLTHGATLRWLAHATKAMPRGAAFSLLDVAYGQGDLLRRIALWAARRGLRAELSGVDLIRAARWRRVPLHRPECTLIIGPAMCLPSRRPRCRILLSVRNLPTI